MDQQTILVVDDEADILELVSFHLKRDGYDVVTAATGEEAIAIAREEPPDAILLDLMLPGVNGLDVCRVLKGDDDTASIPIVFLTARGEESDVVKGLELGGDDYITKPFSHRVVVARLRAVLRRAAGGGPGPQEEIVVEDVVIHPGRHEVVVAGQPVSLTQAEFSTLHHLARRPGWVSTRQQIVEAVHGRGYVVTDRSVDVMIVGLRKKLGEHGSMIETVRGVGYRLKGSG